MQGQGANRAVRPKRLGLREHGKAARLPLRALGGPGSAVWVGEQLPLGDWKLRLGMWQRDLT